MKVRDYVPACWLTTASALASVGLALALVAEKEGVWVFAVWLLSLVLGVAASGRRIRVGRLATREWALVAVLTAIGAGFRLWQILNIPDGLWIDELATAANTARRMRGPFLAFGTTPLFANGPEWVHTTNLYLYACLAVLKPLGFSQLGIKLISVLPGLAATPALYLLARRFLPAMAAFAAAGLLATSPWHVTVSRWGWDQVLVTTLAIVGFAWLHDGVEDRSPRSLYAAGVTVGLAQFAYLAARLLALGATVTLLLRAITLRDRRLRMASVLFAAGLLQTALPLVVISVREPLRLHARVEEVSIVPALMRGDVYPLLANLRAYGLMFNLSGDRNPRQNLPGAPMLSPGTGLLFLAGLAMALARPCRPGVALTLVWLACGMLGGLLSDPESAPNSYRVGVVEPACMLLAGLAVAGIAAATKRAAGARGGPLAWLATLAAVGVSAALTFSAYFVVRPASRECWQGLEDGAETEILRRAAEAALARHSDVVLDPRLRGPTAALLFGDVLPARWPERHIEISAELPGPVASASPLLLTTLRRWTELPQAWRARPSVVLSDPFSGDFATAIAADAGVAAAIRAATSR